MSSDKNTTFKEILEHPRRIKIKKVNTLMILNIIIYIYSILVYVLQVSFLNLWGNTIEALAGLSIYGFLTIAFITDASGMLLHAHPY